ncbi:MAG: transglutaminase family protein [Alphaproteobacteria bacterium]|nr:transglutaminase family protein [Alphaproteobacteria bacterium]
MIHSIHHQTAFNYETTPRSVVQRLHLTPLENAHQHVIEWNVSIEGGEIVMETVDYHGNRVHLCRKYAEATQMQILCGGQIDVTDMNGIVGMDDSHLPLDLFKNPTSLSMPGPLLRQVSKEMRSFKQADVNGDLQILHELSARILANIGYSKGKTDINTTAEMAMEIGAGVCQDHVHAFTAVARLLGYSARYVSGYLMMHDEKIQEASHAWAEVYVEGLGWVGFDISNGISPDDRYVKLATGFDYADVIPLSGVRFGSGDEQIATRIMVSQQ